jgi:hypothetical protein
MVGRVLLDQQVSVEYGQLYVLSDEDSDRDLERAFAGQVNGLCGAAIPGCMFLKTGLRFGTVGLRVELHEPEPPLDDSWEEAVEVSFACSSDHPWVAEWEGDSYPIAVPAGEYRVRYCARGMQQGRDRDQLYDEDPVDFYLLQFWRGPVGADRVLRRTSEAAAYWHRAHRGRPLPPDEQLVEDESLEESRKQYFRDRFGGRMPNARLRALDGSLAGMLELDRDLLMVLSELDDDVLRSIARWSATRALTVAGLDNHPDVRAAAQALSAGQPVPPPFDTRSGWHAIADHVTHLTYVPYLPGWPSEAGGEGQVQQWNALGSLSSVSADDALKAVIGAVEHAAVTHGAALYGQFLTDLRERFPPL